MTVSPKALLVTVLIINSLAFLILFLDVYWQKKDFKVEDALKKHEDTELGNFYTRLTPTKEIPETAPAQGAYTFIDPSIAHSLLKELDIFEVVKAKKKKYSGSSGGFKANNKYCAQHRTYFVNNPDFVFQTPKIVTNYRKDHKARTQVISRLGEDLHPEIYRGGKYKKSYDIRVDANLFFTYDFFYNKKQAGKQFSCLSQSSNHIQGHDKMARKDYVGQALVDYAKLYKSRPSCFSFDKYFPQTWLLEKKDQCVEFFTEFQSPHYLKLKKERNIVFFRKKPTVHEGKGVFPVNNEQEAYLRKLYKNGTECGNVTDNNMIQYNVHNPLLIEGHKFGLRMYLLIASTNPVIAYYQDGYLRLSMNEYDPQSQKIETFVTNIGVNLEQAQKGNVFNDLTEEEIQERTSWFVEDLHKYLLKTGQTKDPNWANNYFRPEMKKVMIHLIRMAQKGFQKKSSMFEIFGVDFIMDENLGMWFIEANAVPLLDGFTEKSTKLMNGMLMDAFEIVLGLQKSRMKRVINYINDLTEEGAFSTESEILDLEQKRREFKKLTMNYFEPEFEPSVNNKFEKIIDENLKGTARYANLIESKCL